MSAKRLFVDAPLREGQALEINADGAHYIGRVLRARPGDQLSLFNGDGRDFSATISTISKRSVVLSVAASRAGLTEPATALSLWLALSRNEKMDLAIQKAVELGVSEFQPLVVSRSVMQLDAKRLEKRMQHWNAVVISATQQCGRSHLMRLHAPRSLDQALADSVDHGIRLLALPDAENTLPQTLDDAVASPSLCIAIGPEGGFAPDEVALMHEAGFQAFTAGPRVLRTETAAIALVAAAQVLLGDWR